MQEQANFRGGKDFCPTFPKLVQKVVVQLLPTVFVVWLPTKRPSLVFLQPWAPFGEVKQRWAPFLPRFSGILFGFSEILFGFSEILPKFSTDKTFGGAFAPLAPLTPTPLPTHFSAHILTLDAARRHKRAPGRKQCQVAAKCLQNNSAKPYQKYCKIVFRTCAAVTESLGVNCSKVQQKAENRKILLSPISYVFTIFVAFAACFNVLLIDFWGLD